MNRHLDSSASTSRFDNFTTWLLRLNRWAKISARRQTAFLSAAALTSSDSNSSESLAGELDSLTRLTEERDSIQNDLNSTVEELSQIRNDLQEKSNEVSNTCAPDEARRSCFISPDHTWKQRKPENTCQNATVRNEMCVRNTIFIISDNFTLFGRVTLLYR